MGLNSSKTLFMKLITYQASASLKRKADDVLDSKVKKFRSAYRDTVTVIIGNEAGKFVVYEDWLCNRSRFFKAACSHVWAEGQDKVVKMPYQNPALFQAYLEWVYGEQDLASLTRTVADVWKEGRKKEGEVVHTEIDAFRAYGLLIFAGFWILGDYLNDVDFKNATLTGLHHALQDNKDLLSRPGINKIFEQTPPESKVQLYIVDYAAESMATWDAGFMAKVNADFKEALLKVLLERKEGAGKRAVKKIDVSKYHESDEFEQAHTE